MSVIITAMTTLFNDGWQFAELPIDYNSMFKDNKPVLLNPKDFYEKALKAEYKSVQIPHDWQIWHVQDLYKNSTGCYRKTFSLTPHQLENRRTSIRFEGVYMNSAVFVNNQFAGEWKYGYSTFEFDITNFVKPGENLIVVIAVYQNCNTRWYSGAGIFRDVWFNNTPLTYLVPDGTYIVNKPVDKQKLNEKWQCKITTEVHGDGKNCLVQTFIKNKDGITVANGSPSSPSLTSPSLSIATEVLQLNAPVLWDTENPYLYTAETQLTDLDGNLLDSYTQNCGFKTAEFTADKGFFLNGRHLKIQGACHHHDQGALGSAFDKNALRRQFLKLKEMGVNSVRCSHNPPPKGWMDLCDELGILVDDEAFDMWEKPKTPFDYGNWFNEWHERDAENWVRKDRNHPCLIMWSIGNEIYDTHIGNGYEITKKLYKIVEKNDPEKNAQITIASNYMMTDGAQHCAQEIDTVGYNYLERLYDEHHKKYPGWKIYGSETASTVQSRGIYHFPDTLKLVTFSDGQCSTLGNCTTTWGCESTQKVITNDRDCPFSAGQYIWTGWDYIGEPTPYHSKNSYFGQIDTAGFPKDTYYLYKSEWAGKNAEPFVHLLPYWDWNEGQIIDVKAYTNADSVELFFNEKSLGCQKIDHVHGMRPFGQWQLEYHKGKVRAVAYDAEGKIIAEETKESFGDPAKILLQPENYDTGSLFFIDIMTADKNGILVENARNYITINVDGAELIGMDNGDSTDYDEYKTENGHTLSRKLFMNRAVCIVRAEKSASFTITAASKELPSCALKYENGKWSEVSASSSVKPEKEFIPVRKIEITADGSPKMTDKNRQINVTAKVLPDNASVKEINWNPVLKECVSSDYIKVEELKQSAPGVQTATIKAMCDGECILRCVSKNGTKLDQVISDLNFSVDGIGNPKLNPYKLIEGCRFSGHDESKGKPTVSLESGISNRGVGATWISFDKVDFGSDGADTIHIPIFSFETEIPLQVWDGEPAPGTDYNTGAKAKEGSECLGKFTYRHESIYNTFNENVFTLEKRLFGVHTITIVMQHEHEFKGFYFDKTPKAYAKLRALDADVIVGDTFTKTKDTVEGIGNNVNLDFSNMDFGDAEEDLKLVICGKSNTENNTINLKFFGKDETSTQVIEFSHTDGYEERTIKLQPVKGLQKVSFVFLPGCNFDFKWFKFSN